MCEHNVSNRIDYVQRLRVNDVQVTLGTNNITENPVHGLQFRSNDFHIHPEWNRHTRVNDIALIRLPEKIEFSGIIYY